jgi:hypothetical protein
MLFADEMFSEELVIPLFRAFFSTMIPFQISNATERISVPGAPRETQRRAPHTHRHNSRSIWQ